ncbi:MAG: hypothetical protein ACOYIE_09930 [Agathobaculum sp.]|jgi:DNA-binding transcriptional LysR family regulator|uniref:hypothetical protein n=1 Tax=Agathobaculum sp. TaxID=2048138 RepID=UPI003D9279BF
MEAFALLGGFVLAAALGGCMICRLPAFKGQAPQKAAPAENLHIAVANAWVLPFAAAALRDIHNHYPQACCSIILGDEEEILQLLSAGLAEVAIVSDTETPDAAVLQHMEQGCVAACAFHANAQRQTVFWICSMPSAAQFVKRLCRQTP